MYILLDHSCTAVPLYRVPTSSGNHGKTWKITQKSSMHEKSWNLVVEKSWTFVRIDNLTKPPVARKLAVRHTKLVCLTASFLATGGFKF